MNQFVKRWVFSISCSFFSEFVRHYEAKKMVFACLTEKLENVFHNIFLSEEQLLPSKVMLLSNEHQR
jgi:hypothetical protein